MRFPCQIALISAWCVVAAVAQEEQSTEGLRTAFLSLQKNGDKKRTDEAWKLLCAAGSASVFVAANELENSDTTDSRFVLVELIPWNPPRDPTMGDLAYSFILSRIEPFGLAKMWPDPFRRHDVNAWLDDRRGKSLNELKVEAARTRLAKAEARYKADAEPHELEMVQSIKRHVEFVRAKTRIEPNPPPYSNYSPIEPGTYRDWLETNRNKTLSEMRIQAAADALKRAEDSLEDLNTSSTRAIVREYRAHLAAVRKTNAANKPRHRTP